MDGEGLKRLFTICAGALLVFSIFQIVPGNHNPIIEVRAESQWLQDEEFDLLQGTFDKVALYGTGSSAELGLEINANGRWEMMSPSIQPMARRGHVIAPIYGTDKVLLFGGYNGDYLDDTLIYDLSDDEWIDIMPVGGNPSARHSYAMTFVYGTNSVLLFGGDSQSIMDNETWLYDFTLNTWTKLNTINAPSAREYHELEPVYNDDKVILYGGFDGTNYLDDTWVFDVSDRIWTFLSPVEQPSPRKGHEMATIYGTDEIVSFGGNESGIRVVDDTWIYKYSTNLWTNATPAIGNPSPRRGQGMGCFFETDEVLLFGPDEETWIYDLSENVWTVVTTSINPLPRYITHGVAPIFNDDKVVLFGGGFDDNGTIIDLNDTWMYDREFYEEEGTYVSSPYEMGDNALLKTISWIEDLPPGTDVKIQIRSAPTEAGLSAENFVGFDGSTGTFYTESPGQSVWQGHVGDLWVQYKILLSGNFEDTPLVQDIKLTYNILPDAPQILGPPEDVWISQNTPEFSWTFSDLDSLQGAFQILVDDDENFLSIDFDSDLQASGSQSWQFPQGTSYTSIPDGIWYWKVRTQDTDGDWGPYSSRSSVKIDTTPPVPSISAPADKGFYSGLTAIYGTASDSEGSGVQGIEITIKNLDNDLYWTGSAWEPGEFWLAASGASEWTYDPNSVNLENNEEYEIGVRATDFASNLKTSSQKNIFTIDSYGPSITINPQLNMVYLNHLDTITGSSQDPSGSGVDDVKIKIVRNSDFCSWDGTSWVTGDHWLSVAGTNTWSFDSRNVDWQENTFYSVKGRATDKTGNTGEHDEVLFLMDHDAPVDLSIIINNGDSFTNDPDVTLSLSAEDPSSGLDKMSFSSDGMQWSAWENYKATRSYTLSSGDGEKTIYFRVMDKSGNQADGIFAIITLDTSGPISDSDGDGIVDDEDAFPLDPAASVDTDSDGYPDSWNPGKSQGHSTTGLTIDEYPDDPQLHTKEITQPGDRRFDTYWFLIVPLIAVVLLVIFILLMWRNKKKINKLVLFYRRYF